MRRRRASRKGRRGWIDFLASPPRWVVVLGLIVLLLAGADFLWNAVSASSTGSLVYNSVGATVTLGLFSLSAGGAIRYLRQPKEE